MSVVCDYLTLSTPLENGPALFGALADVVLQLDGAMTAASAVVVDHGRLHYQEWKGSNVSTVSASGVLLAKLRAAQLLFDYCSTVANCGPYKVTHTDLALDLACDAPAKVAEYYGRLRLSGAGLTRKRTPASAITAMLSPGADGRDTGTVFIGNRKRAETTAIIYDRQHDAIAKGKPDPGPLLRIEVRTGVPGMTLKDVVEPAPLFYYFAAPDLVDRPATVADWQAWGEGFEVPPREVDGMMRLVRLVERSGDLERMLRLARELDGGYEHLIRLIQQRVKVDRQTVAFEAGTSGTRSVEQPPTATVN